MVLLFFSLCPHDFIELPNTSLLLYYAMSFPTLCKTAKSKSVNNEVTNRTEASGECEEEVGEGLFSNWQVSIL